MAESKTAVMAALLGNGALGVQFRRDLLDLAFAGRSM